MEVLAALRTNARCIFRSRARVSEPGVATFSGAGAGPPPYQYRPVDMVMKMVVFQS